MCEVIDACAEIELNNLVLRQNAHCRAMAPIRAIQNKTKAATWGPQTKNDVTGPRGCTMLSAGFLGQGLVDKPVAPMAYQVILEPGIGQFREFESP